MTQLGLGMRATPMPDLNTARIVLADGSSEAVAQFCTEAMAVLQQVASVAQALGGVAGALAAAAGEVAANSRTASQRDQAIIQNLGQLTRLVDQCCQMMADMDLPAPQVTVEATARPAEVTVLPAHATTKTVTLTDSQGRTVTGTVTEQ
jgi:ABC-type transporter Mla subunit MlaD